MAGKRQNSWLNAPNVSFAWVIAAASLCTVLLYSLQQTQFGQDADAQLARPLEFRIRERLGQTPKLDPRIKILAMDDAAVSFLGSPTLNTWQWTTLLSKVVEQKPAAVLIDGLFTLNPIPEEQSASIHENIKKILDSGVPIIAGASIMPNEIPYREALSYERKEYQIAHWTGVSEQSRPWFDVAVPWRGHKLNVYGADENLRALFSGIGHIMYFGRNDVRPFFRVDEQHVVPQLAFWLPPNAK